MKYMFLLTGDEEQWRLQPPEQAGRVLASHQALERELEAQGKFVDGDPLQPEGRPAPCGRAARASSSPTAPSPRPARRWAAST